MTLPKPRYQITAVFSLDGGIRREEYVTLEGAVMLADSIASLCPDWDKVVLVPLRKAEPIPGYDFRRVEYMVTGVKTMDSPLPKVTVMVENLARVP